MPKSPSHHPSKHPPQTPVKWRSPRRCSNEGQIGNGNVSFQSNFLWNLFLLSASVVFPLIDWCLSFQGYCKDTILMEDSPVKWRSPRRCLNKDDGSVSFYFIFLKFFLFLFISILVIIWLVDAYTCRDFSKMPKQWQRVRFVIPWSHPSLR